MYRTAFTLLLVGCASQSSVRTHTETAIASSSSAVTPSEVDECAQLRGWLRNTERVSHQQKPLGLDPHARDAQPPRYVSERIRRLADEDAQIRSNLDAHAGDPEAHQRDVAAMRDLFKRAESACHFEPIAQSPESELPAHPEVHRAPVQIQRVVRKGFPRLRACYEAGLGRNRALQGRVAMLFAIDADGRVTHVADAGSSLPDRRVVDCILHGIEALTFPADDAERTVVQYPIIFNPAE